MKSRNFRTRQPNPSTKNSITHLAIVFEHIKANDSLTTESSTSQIWGIIIIATHSPFIFNIFLQGHLTMENIKKYLYEDPF